MIDRKFLFYETRNAFERDLKDGLIQQDSIVFIKSDLTVWTHGVNFNTGVVKQYVDNLLVGVNQSIESIQGFLDNNVQQMINEISEEH